MSAIAKRALGCSEGAARLQSLAHATRSPGSTVPVRATLKVACSTTSVGLMAVIVKGLVTVTLQQMHVKSWVQLLPVSTELK